MRPLLLSLLSIALASTVLASARYGGIVARGVQWASAGVVMSLELEPSARASRASR